MSARVQRLRIGTYANTGLTKEAMLAIFEAFPEDAKFYGFYTDPAMNATVCMVESASYPEVLDLDFVPIIDLVHRRATKHIPHYGNVQTKKIVALKDDKGNETKLKDYMSDWL